MRVRFFAATVVVVAVGLFVQPLRAQPLADRVPEDAIVYVGWRGSSDLGPAYEQSHLKGVLDASNLPQFLDSFLPNVAKRLRATEPEGADAVNLVATIAKPLRKYPSAVYFGGIDTTVPEAPQVKLAILCQAGAEAPQLLKNVQAALAKIENPDVSFSAEAHDGCVVVSTFAGFEPKPAAPLSGNEDFTAAIGRMQKDPVAAVYVDNAKLLDLVDLLVSFGDDADARENWPKVRKALALDGIRRVVWTAGFDRAEWANTVWVEAPAPRRGLLAALEGKPLDDAVLKAVPKDASVVTVTHFDLAKLLAEVRATLKELDPQAAQQFEQGLSAASMFLGANVQTDLIEPLGGQWISYAAPGVGGNSVLGMVAVNKLDDPAKAARTLDLLAIAINNTIAGQMRDPGDPKIAFQRTKIAGAAVNVNYLAVPFVSPAWVVKDGNLYVGLYPQTVVAAASQDAKAAGSILDNEAFQQVRQRLGDGAQGVQFIDLPRTAPDAYGSVLMYSRLLFGMSDMFGVLTPPMVVPTLAQLRPHLVPAGAATRFDEQGVTYRSVTPFPGAGALGVGSGAQFMVGNQAVLLSVLLPSLNRARETANRVKSASNLRQMGQGLLLYSNENRGKYPTDFETVKKYLLDQGATPEVFDSPLGNGPDGEDYVYLYYEGLNNTAASEVIVAYDAAALNRGLARDGTNVLFGDGHVEWMNPAQLRLAIERSREAAPKSVPQDIPIPGGAPAAQEMMDAEAEADGAAPPSRRPLRPRPRPEE